MEIGKIIKDLLAGPQPADGVTALQSVSWLAASQRTGAGADGAREWHVTCYCLRRSGEKGNGGVWQRRPAVVGQAR